MDKTETLVTLGAQDTGQR